MSEYKVCLGELQYKIVHHAHQAGPGIGPSGVLDGFIVDRLGAVKGLARWGQRVLEPCGAVEQHSRLAGGDRAIREAVLVGRIRGCALRAQEDTLFVSKLDLRSVDLVVVHCCCKSIALADSPDDEEVPDGRRDTDAHRGPRVGVVHASGKLLPFFVSIHYRSAALGLHCHHPRLLGSLWPDAEFLELLESLPHADQASASTSRVENDCEGQMDNKRSLLEAARSDAASA